MLNSFLNEYHDNKFYQMDITNPNLEAIVAEIFSTRANDANNKNSTEDIEQEKIAINRLLKMEEKGILTVSVLEVSGNPIAFSIDEILPRNFALSHFCKTDNSFKGAYQYLNMQTAKLLEKSSVLYWNWEQDLNIEGLRKSKMKNHPVNFLKSIKLS
ncbi:MAG: phosphatidylglycerol lysyltransferase domain-containing protein [Candidatus Pacebacteria bacterium]|nr:phosphatidylglycerol lysyltransferase domain-containing protein [Candidatus Paceibacterota bacterium]